MGRRIHSWEKDNAKLLGIFVGTAVFLLLFFGILSKERLGTMDNGRYGAVMESAGLVYLESENPDTRYFNHVIERYGYGTLHFWKLLAPNGECSILYPITLIRLLTQPFGVDFSTQYLAILYAFLLAVASYVLVRACGYAVGWAAVFPGGLMVLAASSPNLVGCLNSLYTTGTTIVGLVLMAAMAMRMFTYGRQRLWGSMVLFLAAASFGLNASPLCVAFVPFAVAVTAAGLTLSMHDGKGKPVAIGLTLAALAMIISSSAQYHRENADIRSDASAYNAAFAGFLEASDSPADDLRDFGLDESYLEDVGKSYYLSGDQYRHNPQNTSEATVLFKKINKKTIGSWYWHHPLRLLQTANFQQEKYNVLEFDMALQVGQRNGDANRIWRGWSLSDTLLKLLLPENYSAMAVLLLLAAIGAVWIFLRLRKQGIVFAILAAGAYLCFGAAAYGYILLHLRFMGRDFLSASRVVGVFGLLMSLGGALTVVSDAAQTLSFWFRQMQEQVPERQNLDEWRLMLQPKEHRGIRRLAHGIWGAVRAIAADRRKTVLTVFLIAVGMSAVVQFSSPRAGGVNNGDFWRMMEQLGITWEQETLETPGGTANHWLVEHYDYQWGFDWKALTPLSPKYSLIYPAALVRLISNCTGQNFNTWYLSIIMNVVLLWCLLSMVYDLYGLLGNYTLLFGLLLCGVFLSENYLVWFNSLFGESCMFMGLFMMLACCVHLAVKSPRKCWPTVFLLLFGGRILICAKAQMLVTLPIVLLLIAIFAVYQRPKRVLAVIPYALAVIIGCGVICSDGVRVYQDNAKINEHYTVWQATFYGALMSADDPDAAMEELGIDKRMKPNIGTHAYEDEERYTIGPNSPEADAALYDHVNTFTMVKYYLHHPIQLLGMLDHAAEVSRPLYNGLRTYQGMDYAVDQNRVQRFALWMYWRQAFTCGTFLGYVLLYGAAMCVCIFGVLRKKDADIRWKLLAVIYLGVMLIGAVQYPLSVIGNGYADNHKQMFGFMMCHDFLVLFSLVVGLRYLRHHGSELLAAVRAIPGRLRHRSA